MRMLCHNCLYSWDIRVENFELIIGTIFQYIKLPVVVDVAYVITRILARFVTNSYNALLVAGVLKSLTM